MSKIEVENKRKCKVCKKVKPLIEFEDAGIKNGKQYYAHKCKPCYNAGRIQTRNPEKAQLNEVPRIVVFDKSTGKYVEYAPVAVVEQPKQVDKVLQFLAARGLIVFKMSLGG